MLFSSSSSRLPQKKNEHKGKEIGGDVDILAPVSLSVEGFWFCHRYIAKYRINKHN